MYRGGVSWFEGTGASGQVGLGSNYDAYFSYRQEETSAFEQFKSGLSEPESMFFHGGANIYGKFINAGESLGNLTRYTGIQGGYVASTAWSDLGSGLQNAGSYAYLDPLGFASAVAYDPFVNAIDRYVDIYNTEGAGAAVGIALTDGFMNTVLDGPPRGIGIDLPAIKGKGDVKTPGNLSKVEDLFGQTLESIELSHLPNWKTGSLVNDGKLGEQLVLQTLNEKTGLNLKPLQNDSNWGCDGCAVDIKGDTITVVVVDAKSSVNGVGGAKSAAGDPRTRLEGWLRNGSITQSDPALAGAIQKAIEDGAKIQGMTVKVGLPAPGTTGEVTFKVEPWPNK